MSGTLICSATNCVHNMNGLCSANKIQVGGKNAYSSRGTDCNTFAKKGLFNAVANLTNMNIPGEIRQLFNKDEIEMSPKIECEAVNCVYNTNKVCNANRVAIVGTDATSNIETQCETFMT